MRHGALRRQAFVAWSEATKRRRELQQRVALLWKISKRASQTVHLRAWCDSVQKLLVFP